MNKNKLFKSAALLSAAFLIGTLSSCGGNNTHTITFEGKNYSVDGNEVSKLNFKAGESIKYKITANIGYVLSDNITVKFGTDEKIKGVDYNFDGETFTIEKAPDLDVTLNIPCSEKIYNATFIGENESTYSVAEPKEYKYGDELVFNLVSNSGALFPESINVYFGGELQDPSSGVYQYVQIQEDGFANKAKLTIPHAPAAHISVGIVEQGKHVVYFEGLNAKYKDSYKNYAQVGDGGSLTLEIVADANCTLPEKENVEVYKGGSLIKNDFEYKKTSVSTAEITLNNVVCYFAIYFTAQSDALLFEDIPETNNVILKGKNPKYESELVTLKIPDTYNGKKVTKIEDSAFKNMTEITSLERFGKYITEIGDSSFFGCSKMVINDEVTLNVTKIGSMSFKGCANIQKISIPKVEIIGSYAFEGCAKMKFNNFMLALREIDDYAFKNCTSLGLGLNIDKDHKPLIISAGATGFGFDINKLGNNICDGWTNEQLVFFGGDAGSAEKMKNLGYAFEARKDEKDNPTGYYYEVAGGSRVLNSVKGVTTQTIAFTDLNNYTWKDINDVSINGQARYLWNIGDTKTIVKDDKNYTFRIIGFSHDSVVDGTAGGLSKAGITFEASFASSSKIKYSTETTAQYDNSNIRKYLNETLYNSDEFADIKPYIKKVKKSNIKGHGDYSEIITQDYLFALSLNETGEDLTKYSDPVAYAYKTEGSTYEYYKNSGISSRSKTTVDATAVEYYLRTPLATEDSSGKKVFSIKTNGESNSDLDCTTELNYTFAFCI